MLGVESPPNGAAVALPKPDVDQETFVHVHEQGHVTVVGNDRTVLAPHRGRQPIDVESELLQQPGEQPVELITEPSQTAKNNLVIRGLFSKVDGDSQVDIEVLERYALEVRRMRSARTREFGSVGPE